MAVITEELANFNISVSNPDGTILGGNLSIGNQLVSSPAAGKDNAYFLNNTGDRALGTAKLIMNIRALSPAEDKTYYIVGDFNGSADNTAKVADLKFSDISGLSPDQIRAIIENVQAETNNYDSFVLRIS